jgi:hypothetical protein
MELFNPKEDLRLAMGVTGANAPDFGRGEIYLEEYFEVSKEPFGCTKF